MAIVLITSLTLLSEQSKATSRSDLIQTGWRHLRRSVVCNGADRSHQDKYAGVSN